MAAIIATGYRAPTPRDVVSMSQDGWWLDESLREIGERFEPHLPILLNLAERVNKLRTWGADWADYDAPPPADGTVDRALDWIQHLYVDVLVSGPTWIDPLITASEEGEAMFEWQIRGRRLTIEVTEAAVSYSKLWGTPPHLQFEDGLADTPQRRQSLWAWLAG
jgi:hypothetical protein